MKTRPPSKLKHVNGQRSMHNNYSYEDYDDFSRVIMIIMIMMMFGKACVRGGALGESVRWRGGGGSRVYWS